MLREKLTPIILYLLLQETKQHTHQALPLSRVATEETVILLLLHISTIRKEFALSKGENSVHGSDSPEAAAREIAFFFSGLELVG
jgi:hypothetical protein